MDSLHLFTIPKWLPNTLLPEIWTILFCWKWRLEMKDINRVLIEKTSNIHTCCISWTWFCDYKNILSDVALRLGYNVSHNHVWIPSDEPKSVYG